MSFKKIVMKMFSDNMIASIEPLEYLVKFDICRIKLHENISTESSRV